MAKDNQPGSASAQSSAGQPGGSNGTRKKPVRKVYDYTMTDKDKVALHTVQAAKNVCTAIAIAIQSGRPVKSEVVNQCLDLQKAGAGMLFD